MPTFTTSCAWSLWTCGNSSADCKESSVRSIIAIWLRTRHSYSLARQGRLPRYCTVRATHSWGQAPRLSLKGQVWKYSHHRTLCREKGIAWHWSGGAFVCFPKLEINADLFCNLKILLYLCRRLLLVIGAFGRQSSMKNVAIISCSMCSPLVDGVTLRSGYRLWKYAANDN